MQCLILAGGLGTRMQGYDSTLPKTLLPVAGRPFADWQLRWLAAEGVDSIVYSIGYKGDLVREFVGTGEQWGLTVRYVEEADGLLGTGGAVRLAIDREVTDERFFVLYGDSYLRVNLRSVDRAFQDQDLPALMTVFENDGQWDASNVVFDGSKVIQYRKGADPSARMRYIDYGLLELDEHVVATRIQPGEVSDLSSLLESLSDESLLGGYEVFERFYEIGSPDGIHELNALLGRGDR